MDLISFGNSTFALRYGKYAEDFDYVSPSGGQGLKVVVPLIIAFITLIIGFIFIAKPKRDPSQPEPPATPLQNVMKGFGFVLLFVALSSFGFYGYVYFVKFLPEYYEWFGSLPNEAKAELAMISFAEKFMNNNKR